MSLSFRPAGFDTLKKTLFPKPLTEEAIITTIDSMRKQLTHKISNLFEEKVILSLTKDKSASKTLFNLEAKVILNGIFDPILDIEIPELLFGENTISDMEDLICRIERTFTKIFKDLEKIINDKDPVGQLEQLQLTPPSFKSTLFTPIYKVPSLEDSIFITPTTCDSLKKEEKPTRTTDSITYPMDAIAKMSELDKKIKSLTLQKDSLEEKITNIETKISPLSHKKHKAKLYLKQKTTLESLYKEKTFLSSQLVTIQKEIEDSTAEKQRLFLSSRIG